MSQAPFRVSDQCNPIHGRLNKSDLNLRVILRHGAPGLRARDMVQVVNRDLAISLGVILIRRDTEGPNKMLYKGAHPNPHSRLDFTGNIALAFLVFF